MENTRNKTLLEIKAFLEKAAPEGSKSWAKDQDDHANSIKTAQNRVLTAETDSEFANCVKAYVGAWFKAFEEFVAKKHERGEGLELADIWHAGKVIEGFHFKWNGLEFVMSPRSTARADGKAAISAAEVMLLRESELPEKGKEAIINIKTAFPGARIGSITTNGVERLLVPEVLT